MKNSDNTFFSKNDVYNKNILLKLLSIFLFFIFLAICSISVNAAPDGYCVESNSYTRAATWIKTIDYELYPTTDNPESMKITVEILFTTDGVALTGSAPVPNPSCNDDFRYVNAWIDWNGDYSFDSSEQVLNEELFWYDESYQIWCLTHYGTDIDEYFDILTLSREKLTGKSIQWYSYDSPYGGIGVMTLSKIVPIPKNYENDTWMRINYGWLYNPQNPCDIYEITGADPYTSWEYGDAKYKQISTTPDLLINSSDISIKEKTKSPDLYCDFKDAILTATVHNDGKLDAENVDVLLTKMQYNSSTASSEIITINSISAESSVNVTFKGNFDPYRFKSITIELDPENTIWENNESNNIAKTHRIEGFVYQHHDSLTGLPMARVDIRQKIGSSYNSIFNIITNEDGFYKCWTNTKYLTPGLQTIITPVLEYRPNIHKSCKFMVVNESIYGNNVYTNTNTAVGNYKNSPPCTLQVDKEHTYDAIFSGIEGGVVYDTLVKAYRYHEKLNTAPTSTVYININDDDFSDPADVGPYALDYTIHLPPGKLGGTTDPFTIGHEFTHVVELGWLPTYYGHHPLVPVEEGSCHWGSCIALNNPVLEFEDGSGGFVTIDISNNDHTSNSTPAPDCFAGCREEFQIAGTMWDLNSTLVWNVLHYGYGPCNPLWPSTPLLFYNAYKEVDSRSSLVLKSIFKSHAYNTTVWPGKNGVDPDYFTGIFTDEAIDDDLDGEYDSLQIGIQINITEPEEYIITSNIGKTNIGSSNTTMLTSGLNMVNLTFPGKNIYESQQNGPYNLSFYLYYANYTFLDNRLSFYETQPYSYNEFERPTLLFTGNTTMETTDDDGDGTYDQLIVDLELNLTKSSHVKMYAGLYCNDEFIDNCWGPSMNDGAIYEYVEAGIHNLSLYFNGESIYASKQNGSYELRTYLASARTIQLGSFFYTDFDEPPALLGSLISELTLDENLDGYIDSLDVNITVTGEGTYQLTGNLYNESGAHLSTTHSMSDINSTQAVLISFDGENLRDQQRNGVYNLTVELKDMNGFFIGWKNYTLSSYQYTDFEPSSEEVFDITFNEYGIDNTGQYGYETLCIDMNITSLLPGNYNIKGYLHTDNDSHICSNKISGYIDNSAITHTLHFNGQQIGSTLYNGSFMLDLVFVNDSEIIELSKVYTTGYYTYDSFETTFVFNTTDSLYSTRRNNIPNKLGITIKAYSTVPRYVYFLAQLRDSMGELIDEVHTSDIWAYENDSTLVLFDGYKIQDHGLDGPYTIILKLYDEQGNLLDTYTNVTEYYDHTSFSLITLTDSYSDYGYDADANSIFDYLVVESEVQVLINGFCTISGVLEDTTGQIIATEENTVWLSEGMQTIPLYFNGSKIKNHAADGPYNLKLVSVFHNHDVATTDYMLNAYQTGYYDYTDFDLTTSIVPNQKPISIAKGQSAGSASDSLQFNASASYDPEGQMLSYLWDFGDGETSAEEQPIHAYSTDGVYTVNLTVNDGVQDSYPDTLTVSIGHPVADTGGPYTVYGIQSIIFNGSASYDPEEQTLSYLWDFGDGSTGSGMNPVHTYPSYGTYTAILTVNDGTYESTAVTTLTVLQSLAFDDDPTDSGLDINGDGLYEYLLMKVDATNYIGQNVSTEVTLTDSLGTILSYGMDTQFLNISSYTLSIYFDGPNLFENRVHGPYFVEITIRDNESEILDSLNYTTTAHDYTEFQFNTKIGDVSDYGIDTNGNDSYEYLSVNVSIINYKDRNITLQGTLLDSNGTSIDSTQETRSLTGNITIQLLFEGKTIYAHGENGPYTISLTLQDQYDQLIDMNESITSMYQYTDFEEITITIWTVDDDDGDIPSPPADFSTIQDAIDAASEGDIIQVYSGTYYENIDLNKSLTILGFDQPCIDGDWYGHGIDITADHCNIEGFEFKHAFMGDPDIFTAGIYVQSHNNIIVKNTFDNNENGISLIESNDNVIDSNDLTSGYCDVVLLSAEGNIIKNNTFLEENNGILIFEDSSDNIMYLNTIGKQYENAIDLTMNNSWNSSIPVSYEYDGIEYVGYVGNYWNDHISSDTDHNGVFDTPYTSIAGSGYAIDYYPMVGNWPPIAQANGPYYAESGEDIQFNSSGSIDPEGKTLTFYWDFLDGNTSTEANPLHAYISSNRLYLHPTLNVSDGVFTDTDISTVYVNYPVAIAGGPYYGIEGESVTLDGSASYDPLGPLHKYYWDPDASGYYPSWSDSSKKYVTYISEGIYEPRLRVWSMVNGVSVFSSYSYTNVLVNDTNPSPDFTSNQQSGMAPLSIDFEDSSDSYDGITLWEWDFDNDGIIDVSGTDDLAQSPSFTYSTTGMYSVNLTVHEDDGDMVSMVKTDYITVTEPRPPITIYVPDEYPTIQEAIDAGSTLDGDIIVVRDGVYRQNTVINKALTIRSENGSENCQLFPDVHYKANMITINSDNVTIQGFYMNGTRTSTLGDDGSIFFSGKNNIVISENWINDSSYGIVIDSSQNITLSNNTIINCINDAIYADDVQHLSIISNNLSFSDTGIYLKGDYCTLSNNTANANKYCGIILNGDNNNIERNNLSWNGLIDSNSYEECGLHVKSGNHNVISNNTMNHNYEDGLFLDDAFNRVCDNILMENREYDLLTRYDNSIESNTGSGNLPIIYANTSCVIKDMVVSEILLVDADNSIIQNVTVVGSDDLTNNGIYTTFCNHVHFDRVISNYNQYGIRMWNDNQDDNIISNSTFNFNFYSGVHIFGNRNQVKNSNLNNNGYDGSGRHSGVILYESHDSIIVDNTMNNNSINGVLIDESQNNQIMSNYMMNNYIGINSIDSSNNMIKNNYFINNTDQGIDLHSFRPLSNINNVIYNNMFIGNSADDDGDNVWNITKTEGENIIHGPYIGGNYWSEYEGQDIDGDFLGDTEIPFNSSEDINEGGDYHPLVYPNELYIIPIQNHTMIEEEILSIQIIASGTDSQNIVLSEGLIPPFAYFTDEGNGIGSIEFTPLIGDRGEYIIIINATDDINTVNESFILKILSANLPPVADAGGPYTGETGTSITLDGSGSSDIDGSIILYEWDFDDDGFYDDAIGITPVYNWNTDGIHFIHLKVTDDYNDIGTDTTTVNTYTANQPPISDAGGPYFSNEDESIQFDGMGSTDPDGTIISYSWEFGDGNIGSGPTLVHIYEESGEYTITLTVTDDDNSTDIDTTTVNINSKPVAHAGGPYSGLIGENIQLNASKSIDSDGMITSYEWDLNNDGYYDDANGFLPLISGVNSSLLWPNPGVYIIGLRVADEFGAVDINHTTVQLFESNQPPVAAFSFTPNNPTTADIIEFNSTSYDADGVISNWTWDFGDGNKSYIQNPNYHYNNTGEYLVCLMVYDDADDSDSICKTVIVVEECFTLLLTNDGNGSVLVDPEEPCYDSGDSVMCTPIPDDGWVFVSWIGPNGDELSYDENGSWNIIMDENKEVTAHFEKIITPPCEPEIYLPTNSLTMYVWEFPENRNSAYETELTGIIGSYNVSNGKYNGWCVDYGTPIPNGYDHPHNITLISSYDTLPDHLSHENWSKVNYLINHISEDADASDVQRALFYFINMGSWDWDYTGYIHKPASTETWKMINDAEVNSSDWCPDCGDKIAVICDPGVTHGFQITFIEVTLCEELFVCNPEISLPDYNIKLYAWEFPDDGLSAYDIELEGINQGYNVHDEVYNGWCVDYGTPIPNGYDHPHNVTLYSSYNPPCHLIHKNWSKVNYLINHITDGADMYDIQRAIWNILNFGSWNWNYTGYMTKPVSDITMSMINNTLLNGGDWCPSIGNKIAVICDPGINHDCQITFIEVTLIQAEKMNTFTTILCDDDSPQPIPLTNTNQNSFNIKINNSNNTGSTHNRNTIEQNLINNLPKEPDLKIDSISTDKSEIILGNINTTNLDNTFIIDNHDSMNNILSFNNPILDDKSNVPIPFIIFGSFFLIIILILLTYARKQIKNGKNISKIYLINYSRK